MRLFFYIVCCFITFSELCALDINDKPNSIFKTIYYAKGFSNINEAISSKNSYQELNYFRRFIRKNENNNNSWIKINVSNKSPKALEKELIVKWKNANIHMYLVKNKQVLNDEQLKKNLYVLKSTAMRFDSFSNYEIYLNIKTKKIADEYISMFLVQPKDVFNFVTKREKIYYNGLFFGILLTLMFYSFFMFISIKSKEYLVLGVYQLSVIFYTSDLRDVVSVTFENFPTLSYYFIKIGSSFYIIFLSIILTKVFLNTKKEMPNLNKLLTLSIFVLGYFILNHKYTINYASFLYSLFIICGLYSFYKGNFSALFFTIGFSVKGLYLMFASFVRMMQLNIDFEYLNTIQLIGVFEAFSMSMALYLKIKYILDAKKYADKERHMNEKIMLTQSKFAIMGEMLASIAHQWKQPLNHLNLIIGNLQLAYENNLLDKKYLDKKAKEAQNQLNYMGNTIEDFSTFLSKKEEKENIKLYEVCKEAKELVLGRSKQCNTKIKIFDPYSLKLNTHKNEFIQVLVILLNNSIDQFLKRKDNDNNFIIIRIKKSHIEISDNAGGISEEIMHKIFNPYFSTKNKKFGTGLGLYTAKILLDNILHFAITVKNKEKGAEFILKYEE